MRALFVAYGRFVGQRPRLALGLVFAVSVVAVFGLSLTAPQADPEDAFLPDGSELVDAEEALSESFPQFSDLEAVQVVLRGDVLSPGGAADAIAATRAAASNAELSEFLVDSRPPTSPGHIIAHLLVGDDGDAAAVDVSTATQQEIDAAVDAVAGEPIGDALDGLVARDDAGNVVGGIGVLTVNSNGDATGLIDAQLAADGDVLDTPLGALEAARTFSNGTLLDDSDAAAAFGVLMLVALLVIAGLLVVFYRKVSDVALGLLGLVLTVVWALGFQGLLGPDGFGLIGAPSVLAQMVPIMMIGLCVDYGIQLTSRYREAVADGKDAAAGISEGVAAVMLPLGLAGGTTIISFLTNLFGSISGVADFGAVAAIGVASGLIVFLTGVPAARVLLDRRRERAGKPLATSRMNDAIPGAGRIIESISSISVAKPGVILAVTGVVTIVLGGLTTQLGTEFDSTDFVADGSESKEDLEFFDEFLGGSTEPVTVMVEAEIANDRTLRNLIDLSSGLEDPVQQPAAVASPVTSSLGVFFESLPLSVRDEVALMALGSSTPAIIDPEIVQASLDLVEDVDPEGFRRVASYGSGDRPDRTIVQFDAISTDVESTRSLITDVEGLWLGDDSEITATSGQIINLEVADSLTDNQATSIMLTILAALVVLVLFFWVTEFRPMLAVLSVLPIILVLIWVLGTMVILGYTYNVITALITALSIGIGVDYTIHITHRFIEERENGSRTIAEAISTTMNTTGGALIGSAITTALGFLVLVLAPIPPMGQFGVLTAITVLYSLIAAVVVLPPMLVIWAAYHDWRAAHLTGLEQLSVPLATATD